MLTVLVLVFFAVVHGLCAAPVAGRTGASKQTEQTMTVLQAALATVIESRPTQMSIFAK